MSKQPYIGRFAPSPSGNLHLGSLFTAVCSYLHARQHGGKWLVRIEDIDTPRCVPGADEAILQALSAHGLVWDDSVTYQSTQHAYYQRCLTTLADSIYACRCTRAKVRERNPHGHYDGYCRKRDYPVEGAALRFYQGQTRVEFNDLLLGKIAIADPHNLDDFIVKRKDGLFAYNLVVVADDIRQQVSHIVRGADLLETTASQLALYQAFAKPAPLYLHLPVLCTKPGFKLSKQNHAPPIQAAHAVENLHKVIRLLGARIPKQEDLSSVSATLAWAIEHLSWNKWPRQREIIVEMP
ncbi:tRNA glutamyl-Q(34) synthetase GluQRS [Alteromonas flava]|uniref:tRNA glutamyl-Q(34) synthetase GluQRS n=1 Tax=Alteromonas flava TaxID=2048003 RepID=UPI000C287144|nr:tRNA glutamyl-Q(34) synthetase GluQRS [Alteromonas flava]